MITYGREDQRSKELTGTGPFPNRLSKTHMKLLSIRAAAKLLRCDPRTLKHSIDCCQLPAIRTGKRWKIDPKTLERWASDRRRKRATQSAAPKATVDLGAVLSLRDLLNLANSRQSTKTQE